MMECNPTRQQSQQQQRKDKTAASIASSSKRSTSWRPLRPLRLKKNRRRSRSGPAGSSNSDLPDLVFLGPSPNSSSTILSSVRSNKANSWMEKPNMLAKRVVSVETTEVTLDTERSLEDDIISDSAISKSSPTSIGLPRAEISAELLRTASLRTMEQARELLKDKALTCSSMCLYSAAAVGFLVPFTWIFYAVLLGLFVMFSQVAVKWIFFYWNDRDVVLCRRTIGQLLQRFTRELELTLQGNYARQVMASYVFWATTAPGESLVAAILRYKMNLINMRVIEEMQHTRDRFEHAREKLYGYRKSPRLQQPFA